VQLLWIGCIAFAATFANPAGEGLWETSVGYLGNRYLVNHTAEYLPPDFHQVSTWPFLIMVTASIFILGFKRRRLPAVETLQLGCWTAMALYSARNIPLYTVILSPVFAEISANILQDYPIIPRFYRLNVRLLSIDRLLRGGMFPVVLVLAVALGFRTGTKLDFDQSGNRFDPGVFPVAAVDWLSANPPPGKVFNHFPWGGYLLFRLWPEQMVFIDGQTDFYGEGLTRKYEQVITLAAGWEKVLEDYQVGWMLLPSDYRLTQRLQDDASWEKVYQDSTAAILIRRH
jgi:hypothetical protein